MVFPTIGVTRSTLSPMSQAYPEIAHKSVFGVDADASRLTVLPTTENTKLAVGWLVHVPGSPLPEGARLPTTAVAEAPILKLLLKKPLSNGVRKLKFSLTATVIVLPVAPPPGASAHAIDPPDGPAHVIGRGVESAVSPL